MKKLTLAIFVALVASLAVAQGPGGPGGRPGGPGGPGGRRMDPKAMMEALKKTLNLTPAQVKQVEAMQASRKAEMDKLRAAPGDRRSKGPQMKKMREEYDAKMKKILTKDQQAKYEKMRKDMMSRMGGRPGGRPGGPGGPAGVPGKGGPGGK